MQVSKQPMSLLIKSSYFTLFTAYSQIVSADLPNVTCHCGGKEFKIHLFFVIHDSFYEGSSSQNRARIKRQSSASKSETMHSFLIVALLLPSVIGHRCYIYNPVSLEYNMSAHDHWVCDCRKRTIVNFFRLNVWNPRNPGVSPFTPDKATFSRLVAISTIVVWVLSSVFCRVYWAL